MSFFLRIASALTVAEGLRTHAQVAHNTKTGTGGSINEAYTFDDFVREFGRAYKNGTDEYTDRSALFQVSMSQIHAKNSHGKRSWTAGVNPFMDWTGAERLGRLHGYMPSSSRLAAERRAFVALQTSGKATEAERVYGGADDSFEAETPAVQDQDRDGQCGSCWAFAAVEAVEAQLMKIHSPMLPAGEPRLSVQALLDCVPKESTCDGGCKGSSAENAFDFMQEHGIPLEGDLPYNPRHTGKCPIEPYPLDWVRVTLTGWRALPSNQAQPLMQAIVQDGPATATADAHKWYDYYSGIFDDCPKDAMPNHNVLVRGYGVEDGAKYWLVQNSWGTRWGENGAIRLARQDDEDSWCGVDSEKDGYGCDGDTHMNVTVCGTCGLLYNAVVPQVGYVLVGPGPASSRTDTSSSNHATLEQRQTYESHVKARHAESDVEELAQQLQSEPSPGDGTSGEEAQQLDEAAQRVQAGEQRLAHVLGRAGLARTDDDGSQETFERSRRERELDDEDPMQAVPGDERGKAHMPALSRPHHLARQEALERREEHFEPHAKAESVDVDEEEQALELESAASATSEDDSDVGSEVTSEVEPPLPPMARLPRAAESRSDTIDSRATQSMGVRQANPVRDTVVTVTGVRSRVVPSEDEKPRDVTVVTVTGERSRVVPAEDEKPQDVDVDSVDVLPTQDDEPHDVETGDSARPAPSKVNRAAARSSADADVVNVLSSQKEARALYARVQDRFSPMGSLDGYLRR